MSILQEIEDVNGIIVSINSELHERSSYISVNTYLNSIEFVLQDGPIKEVGVNGCQIDDILTVCKRILESYNENVPSIYTTMAIEKIYLAIDALEQRTRKRIKEGVEGTGRL